MAILFYLKRNVYSHYQIQIFVLLFSDETKLDPQPQEDLEESSESDEDSLQNGETSTNKQVNSNAGENVRYSRT